MTYLEYQNRIAANMNRDDLGVFIPDWINEVREEISFYHPFTFLIVETEINLVGDTYSYVIDANGSTSRYGGVLLSVMYYNATTKTKLPCLNSKLFDRLYPATSAADPTCYTVRGIKFYVDKIPTVVTSKKFTTKYYMLPDLLASSGDQHYMDKRYYGAVIAGVCAKASAYIMSPDLATYWTQSYENEVKKMIAQDTGTRLSDVNLRIPETPPLAQEGRR